MRIAAVNKLADQDLLATIALDDHNFNVRNAAINKLTDQGMLAKVALDAKLPAQWQAALKKLTDEDLLEKVALEAKSAFARQAAFEKLTELLQSGNQSGETMSIEKRAKLLDISYKARDYLVANIISIKKGQESVIFGRQDNGDYFKATFQDWKTINPNDSNSLPQAVKGDLNRKIEHPLVWFVNKEAFEDKNFNNHYQTLLNNARLALFGHISKSVVVTLSDPNIPGKEISDVSGQVDLVRLALFNLSDQHMLETIALDKNTESEIRELAISRLTNRDLLVSITENNAEAMTVRKAADPTTRKMKLTTERGGDERTFVDDNPLILTTYDSSGNVAGSGGISLSGDFDNALLDLRLVKRRTVSLGIQLENGNRVAISQLGQKVGDSVYIDTNGIVYSSDDVALVVGGPFITILPIDPSGKALGIDDVSLSVQCAGQPMKTRRDNDAWIIEAVPKQPLSLDVKVLSERTTLALYPRFRGTTPGAVMYCIYLTDRSSPTNRIREYLTAAAQRDVSITQNFLSTNYKDDLVVEFETLAKSGWIYSEPDTTIESVVMEASGEGATVKALIDFKGGNPPTHVVKTQTFTLVLENGVWKISGMNPAPSSVGPGVVPL